MDILRGIIKRRGILHLRTASLEVRAAAKVNRGRV